MTTTTTIAEVTHHGQTYARREVAVTGLDTASMRMLLLGCTYEYPNADAAALAESLRTTGEAVWGWTRWEVVADEQADDSEQADERAAGSTAAETTATEPVVVSLTGDEDGPTMDALHGGWWNGWVVPVVSAATITDYFRRAAANDPNGEWALPFVDESDRLHIPSAKDPSDRAEDYVYEPMTCADVTVYAIDGLVWSEVSGDSDDEQDDERDPDDYMEQYQDMLSEVYGGTVTVCGMDFDAVRVLREMDPTAYRVGLLDYVDSLDD